MASELSRCLPYHYSAPMSWQSAGFSQEVPSTFHEHLLSHYLLGQARSNHARELKLLDEHLSNMVIHIYLQTLFAEYDLFVHECTERGIPLTPEMLSEKWTELFAFYYGNELTLDEELTLRTKRLFTKFFELLIGHLICLQDELIFQSKVV